MKEKTRPYWKRYSHRLLTVGMISVSVALAFSGCATPEKKAGEPAAYEKISFPEILASPETYKGRTVRLGGVIITTENREKETVLEILEKPLSQTGRPKSGDDSSGRFKVVFAEFLDKAIYRADRSVTIIGEITGMETAPIGEAEYNYPLLSGKEVRLWKEGGYYDWPRMHIGIGVGTGSGGTRGGVGVGTSF